MAEPYNLTALTSNNDIVGTLGAVNNLSNNMFGLAFLLLFTIITFVAFKNYEFKRALSGSLFLSSIIAMFMRVLSLIGDTVMFSYFLITAVSFIWMMWGD
jgi:hypothetical protein